MGPEITPGNQQASDDNRSEMISDKSKDKLKDWEQPCSIDSKNSKRCAFCRKCIIGEPANLLFTTSLRDAHGNSFQTLIFDKRECLIVFERLRRHYGDEYFRGL
jgi:hypothetical protein